LDVTVRASTTHGKLSANASNLLGKTTLWQANLFLCKIFLQKNYLGKEASAFSAIGPEGFDGSFPLEDD
jgi:hypothetical protein